MEEKILKCMPRSSLSLRDSGAEIGSLDLSGVPFLGDKTCKTIHFNTWRTPVCLSRERMHNFPDSELDLDLRVSLTKGYLAKNQRLYSLSFVLSYMLMHPGIYSKTIAGKEEGTPPGNTDGWAISFFHEQRKLFSDPLRSSTFEYVCCPCLQPNQNRLSHGQNTTGLLQ